MNVTVENLAPCKKLVRVEIEAQEVDQTFESVVKSFQREASLPGFRRGKAPRDMIARRYEQEISAEVKQKLIRANYSKAVEESKLEPVTQADIEEIQFGRGQAMLFAATLETAPEIVLPEYKGLVVKREAKSVTDADVERAMEMLRERQATFKTLERPLQTGDVAVVNYTGTCNGKPITDIAPAAKGLTEQKGFWVNIEADSYMPGFAEQLIGAKAGDKRTVNVDFPADFVTPQLVGQKGVYEVEVVEVKEKTLPPLDDTLAKAYGTESIEKMREGVRKDLENELDYKKTRDLRNQLVEMLIQQIQCELPESVLKEETKNVVYDIVRENQQRGLDKDVIEREKDQIYSAAVVGAQNRLKANFILRKIAEKEDIKVSREEVGIRITQLAQSYQIPVEKFVKDLESRNGIVGIYDQVSKEKVMDFLQANAKIEEVAPTEAPAAIPTGGS